MRIFYCSIMHKKVKIDEFKEKFRKSINDKVFENIETLDQKLLDFYYIKHFIETRSIIILYYLNAIYDAWIHEISNEDRKYKEDLRKIIEDRRFQKIVIYSDKFEEYFKPIKEQYLENIRKLYSNHFFLSQNNIGYDRGSILKKMKKKNKKYHCLKSKLSQERKETKSPASAKYSLDDLKKDFLVQEIIEKQKIYIISQIGKLLYDQIYTHNNFIPFLQIKDYNGKNNRAIELFSNHYIIPNINNIQQEHKFHKNSRNDNNYFFPISSLNKINFFNNNDDYQTRVEELIENANTELIAILCEPNIPIAHMINKKLSSTSGLIYRYVFPLIPPMLQSREKKLNEANWYDHLKNRRIERRSSTVHMVTIASDNTALLCPCKIPDKIKHTSDEITYRDNAFEIDYKGIFGTDNEFLRWCQYYCRITWNNAGRWIEPGPVEPGSRIKDFEEPQDTHNVDINTGLELDNNFFSV